MLDTTLSKIRRIIPNKLFNFFQPAYHKSLAFLGALFYGFPSKNIKIIAITGTKGKSSTVEITNAIFEEAGIKTALSNTIRFKIGSQSKENLYKMSMPGRFFIQQFVRKAVNAGCEMIIMEITSQGSLLHRHAFLDLDTVALTNISPEHIQAHGSYENYVEAKVDIARALARSTKRPRTIVVNKDDKESYRFMACKAEKYLAYSLNDLAPYVVHGTGLSFTLGDQNTSSPLSGIFNLSNITAAVAIARSHGIEDAIIAKALTKFGHIPGRVEKIEASQPFTVIVDYAHTPDSLLKLYTHFKDSKKICVLGGTGGGRDSWKRKEMGRIADEHCDTIILTDEDPYDENPDQIVDDVASGITRKSPLIIMDRREAIHSAIKNASEGDVILITGKGTDPYIMGPNDTKIPWSDAKVSEEELKNLGY